MSDAQPSLAACVADLQADSVVYSDALARLANRQRDVERIDAEILRETLEAVLILSADLATLRDVVRLLLDRELERTIQK